MNRIIIIEALLESEDDFVRRCIVLLYEKQEADEQVIKESVYQNGVGFNKSDAEFLTEKAIRIKAGTVTYVTAEMRKRMKKYARQLSNYLTNDELGI